MSSTSDYINSVQLDSVPTGFGGMTGLKILNKASFPVHYKCEISNTTIEDVDEVYAQGGNFRDTIYLVEDKNQFTLDEIPEFNLNPQEYKILNILHKPFYEFVESYVAQDGQETATITIKSNSEEFLDQDIIVDVIGQRAVTFQNPSKLNKFYGIQNFNENENYSVDFYWSYIKGITYATGFKLEICGDTNFSSNLVDSPYYIKVPEKSSAEYPRYGDYDGLLGDTFNKKVSNLPLGQDIYVKISAIDGLGNVSSNQTFCTGFNSFDFVLDDKTLNGDHPDPGMNFRYKPIVGNFIYPVKGEDKYADLTEFLYKQNKNSYDFRRYSGLNIFFVKDLETPSDNYSLNGFSDSDGLVSYAAINLDSTEESRFKFSTNDNNIFNLNLIFEKGINILGRGGRGATIKVESTSVFSNEFSQESQSEDGGPAFNFDNLNYIEDGESDIRVFDYNIYKDLQTVIYGGIAGQSAIVSTDFYSAESFVVREGEIPVMPNIVSLEDTNSDIDINKINGKVTQIGENGQDGKIVSEDVAIYPNIFLSFKPKPLLSNLNTVFKFSTDNLSSAGQTTDSWNSDPDYTKISLSNSSNVLHTREAYGHYFYELEGSNLSAAGTSDGTLGYKNEIRAVKNFIPSLSHSYTSFCFALGRQNLYNNNDYWTYLDILMRCNKIFRFIDASSYEGYKPLHSNSGFTFNGQDIEGSNNHNSLYNFITKYEEETQGLGANYSLMPVRSAFTGSTLNSYGLLADPYNAIINGSSASFNNKEYFKYSNPIVGNRYLSRGIVDNPDYQFWADGNSANWSKSVNKLKNVNISQKNLFYMHNLSTSRTFDSPDKTNEDPYVEFEVNNGSSVTAFKYFSMFFVQMHTTILDKDMNLTSDLSSQDLRFIKNETFINGILTSSSLIQVDTKKINGEELPYLLGINNNSDNNDSSVLDADNVRMFLFDYQYGQFNNVEKRNVASNNIQENLSYKYSNLIFKSSDLNGKKYKLAGVESGANRGVQFPLPISHPFFQIYGS